MIERADLIAVQRTGEVCNGCAFREREMEDDCFQHACFTHDFPADHPMRTAKHQIVWVRKD